MSAPIHAVSERNRRFALLVSLMTSEARRSRRSRRNSLKPEAAMNSEEQPVVTEANTDRVRAGVTGHNVRYVLFGGIALVVVLFVLVAVVMRH
jgi:hypothetical protein